MRVMSRWMTVAAVMLSAGCGTESPTMPSPQVTGGAAATAVTTSGAGPSCDIALHAVLRESVAQTVAGHIQIRITPAESSKDPVLSYRATFGPTGGLQYTTLGASLISRLPDQLPTWTDVQKSDPGITAAEIIRFGRDTLASPALVEALVDDPSRFKAVVSVSGVSGGQEAEGLVAPDDRQPESLRDRYRRCFGIN